MKSIYLLIILLLILYIIKRPLVVLLHFITDELLKSAIDKICQWISPMHLKITNQWRKLAQELNVKRLTGSIFLFLLFLGFCIFNYHLIYYGLELLLPSEEGTGFLGLSPAGLASIVLMLSEVILGFFLFELMGITDLLQFNYSQRKKIYIFLVLFLFVISITIEAGTATFRAYQTLEVNENPTTKFEQFLSNTSYWIMTFLAILIPCTILILGLCLRDIIIFIFWIILGIFSIIFYSPKILYETISSIVVLLDDFVFHFINVITYPIHILVSFIIFILRKIKLINTIISILIFMLFLNVSCSKKEKYISDSILLTILLDNTGSFNKYYNRALENSCKYINTLKGGDEVALFFINEESIKMDKEPLFLKIPKSKTTLKTRTYNKQCMLLKEEFVKKIISHKNDIKAQNTDLAGAINRAASFISKSTQNNIYLFIYSDMQDTKGKDILKNIGLQNVSVVILYADLSDKTLNAVEEWKNKFYNMGAKEVKILTPDDAENYLYKFNR